MVASLFLFLKRFVHKTVTHLSPIGDKYHNCWPSFHDMLKIISDFNKRRIFYMELFSVTLTIASIMVLGYFIGYSIIKAS
ncbi:hypothetical protein CU633_10075 [Bacillus sp. V3-13]|nr:hypothetical protein CU633_10075 [Bacillus sp. V3-13]